MNGESIDEIAPTLGFAIRTFEHKGYKLNIWDVGGQKTIRAFWRNYFEETDGLVWVVDSADVRRLESCRIELHNLLLEERLAGATLLILSNKSDLSGSLKTKDLIEILDLISIKSHRWFIQSCSAVSGSGLLEGISWLVDDISQRILVE